MKDRSLENAHIFFIVTMFLLAFTFGIDVGESLEKRRHCEVLAKASSPTQAQACRTGE